MSMTNIFMGWHRNCGGKVYRKSAGTIVQVTTCDKCSSTSLNSMLSGNDIVTDPYDPSVEDKIASIIQDGMSDNLKYF